MFSLNYDGSQPSLYSFPVNVGSVSETVEVVSEAAQVQSPPAAIGDTTRAGLKVDGPTHVNMPQMAPGIAQQNASANVINLQRRVAGVLPIAIDVPRAGTSFAFVRPLVLDEETKVTFSYKSR